MPNEYIKLGKYLWDRIDAVSNDEEALGVLGAITFNLMQTFGGKYTGFMHDLNMWIGLKRDSPDEFKDYGEGIKISYPDFFKN